MLRVLHILIVVSIFNIFVVYNLHFKRATLEQMFFIFNFMLWNWLIIGYLLGTCKFSLIDVRVKVSNRRLSRRVMNVSGIFECDAPYTAVTIEISVKRPVVHTKMFIHKVPPFLFFTLLPPLFHIGTTHKRISLPPTIKKALRLASIFCSNFIITTPTLLIMFFLYANSVGRRRWRLLHSSRLYSASVCGV